MAGVHCAVAGAGALPIDAKLFAAIKNEDFGAPVVGGFYAGIIDTTKGNIIAADAYQTGERYALIVSPRNLQQFRVMDSTGDVKNEPESLTRWDGLSATNAIIAKNDPRYDAHNYIKTVRNISPVLQTPNGSDWYMPAMDELELLYRNFKPTQDSNFVGSVTATFPGTQAFGVNPSSEPIGTQYSSSNPQQTSLIDFQQSGDQALLNRMWCSTFTDDDAFSSAQETNVSLFWQHETLLFQTPLGARVFEAGRQRPSFKTNSGGVRPVRRVVIPGDLI